MLNKIKMNGNEQFTHFFTSQYESDNNNNNITNTTKHKHIQPTAKSNNVSKSYCQRTPLQSKINKPLNDLINNSSLPKKSDYTLLMKRKVFNVNDDNNNNNKIINEKDELIRNEKENDEMNYNKNKKCTCDNCNRMFNEVKYVDEDEDIYVPKNALDNEELTQKVDISCKLADVGDDNDEDEMRNHFISTNFERIAKFNESIKSGYQIKVDVDVGDEYNTTCVYTL